MLFWCDVGADGAGELRGTEQDARARIRKAIVGEAVQRDGVVLRASRGICRIAEARERQTIAAIAVEDVAVDDRILGTALYAVEKVVADDVVLDRTISPRQTAQVDTRLVPVDCVADELRSPCACRALVDIASSIHEEPRGGKPVRHTVVREPQAVEVVLVQMEEIACADLGGAIDIVLIDRDIDPGVVKKHTTAQESKDTVVQDLNRVDRARRRRDRYGSTSKLETVNDRTQCAGAQLECRRRGNQWSHDRLAADAA